MILAIEWVVVGSYLHYNANVPTCRSAWRGKDRAGWKLVSAVGEMNKSLATLDFQPGMSKEMAEYARVRASITSTVVWISM